MDESLNALWKDPTIIALQQLTEENQLRFAWVDKDTKEGRAKKLRTN